MPFPFTHSPLARALLEEALQADSVLRARGLPALLPHRVSNNRIDMAGPSWAQQGSRWELVGLTDAGMFRLRRRARRRSRLFAAPTSLPDEITLTGAELTDGFPALEAELAAWQRKAGILDDRGSPWTRAERVLIQVQGLALHLSRRAREASQDAAPLDSTQLTRRVGEDETLRANLRAVSEWIRIPGRLPTGFGAALSVGRMNRTADRLARDRLLYDPDLPSPPGMRDLGPVELVVLTNGSDAGSGQDMASYVRDELKATVLASIAEAVSWSDLTATLREGLDYFTATARAFVSRRMCAAGLLLRERSTGRVLIASLGNIAVWRYHKPTATLHPLNYTQTISGLHRLAIDLGLQEQHARIFVYLLITRRASAEEVAGVDGRQVERFWDDFARRNTEALSGTRSSSGQLHHIAIAGVGGSREGYTLAWDMAHHLAHLFAERYPDCYPDGLSTAPLERLSKSFMDLVSTTVGPDDRLLMGSGGFHQLLDLLTLDQAGLAQLPLARMALTRPDAMRCAEWLHMLHSQLACTEDMAAVVMDCPAPDATGRDDLVRGVSNRNTIYRRVSLGLLDPQDILAKPCLIVPPDETRPLGIWVDPIKLAQLKAHLKLPRRKRPRQDMTTAMYTERNSDTVLSRALLLKLSFSDPFADAERLAVYLSGALRPSAGAALRLRAVRPIEELLASAVPGEVSALLAQLTLWLILRVALPPAGPVTLALRWCVVGEAPRPVVELSGGGRVVVLDLLASPLAQPAADYYPAVHSVLPTILYRKLTTRQKSPGEAHRQGQRRRLRVAAERVAACAALPSPDPDASTYLTVRADKQGRILSTSGRRLPEVADDAAALLTGPST